VDPGKFAAPILAWLEECTKEFIAVSNRCRAGRNSDDNFFEFPQIVEQDKFAIEALHGYPKPIRGDGMIKFQTVYL
jgi:hypothetical protein